MTEDGYERAILDALNILGAGEHEGRDQYDPEYPSEEEWINHRDGLRYELWEVTRVLRTAIGLPIKRQKCPHCGAIDSIYWHKNDGERPDGKHDFKCHECDRWIENDTAEWVMTTEQGAGGEN